MGDLKNFNIVDFENKVRNFLDNINKTKCDDCFLKGICRNCFAKKHIVYEECSKYREYAKVVFNEFSKTIENGELENLLNILKEKRSV